MKDFQVYQSETCACGSALQSGDARIARRNDCFPNNGSRFQSNWPDDQTTLARSPLRGI